MVSVRDPPGRLSQMVIGVSSGPPPLLLGALVAVAPGATVEDAAGVAVGPGRGGVAVDRVGRRRRRTGSAAVGRAQWIDVRRLRGRRRVAVSVASGVAVAVVPGGVVGVSVPVAVGGTAVLVGVLVAVAVGGTGVLVGVSWRRGVRRRGPRRRGAEAGVPRDLPGAGAGPVRPDALDPDQDVGAGDGERLAGDGPDLGGAAVERRQEHRARRHAGRVDGQLNLVDRLGLAAAAGAGVGDRGREGESRNGGEQEG